MTWFACLVALATACGARVPAASHAPVATPPFRRVPIQGLPAGEIVGTEDGAFAVLSAAGDKLRVVEFDAQLHRHREVALALQTPPSSTPVLGWDARSNEWLVATVSREPLERDDASTLRSTGDLVPSDGKLDRVTVARFTRDGEPAGSPSVAARSPVGLLALAIAANGTLVRAPSAAPSCGGSPAHHAVSLAPSRDVHLIAGCRLGARLRGAITTHPRGVVAAVTACSSYAEPDSVQLLAFGPGGNPVSAGSMLLPVAHDAFDLRHDGAELWFARAVAISDGDQVIVERVGTDLTLAAHAVVIDQGRHRVISIDLVGRGATLAAVIRRGGASYAIALAALRGAAAPTVRAPTALAVTPCPRAARRGPSG